MFRSTTCRRDASRRPVSPGLSASATAPHRASAAAVIASPASAVADPAGAGAAVIAVIDQRRRLASAAAVASLVGGRTGEGQVA
jgi:hypothetical protein